MLKNPKQDYLFIIDNLNKFKDKVDLDFQKQFQDIIDQYQEMSIDINRILDEKDKGFLKRINEINNKFLQHINGFLILVEKETITVLRNDFVAGFLEDFKRHLKELGELIYG